ncbi:zinc/iron permease [Anaerostipes sp. 992a]|uniref:ABC-F family ATP-binding cassette domain-containing protein n=1 Tax=Anaerostipes sp. 992a TaxID=1261637 RepID=UPI000952B778|nr:ABC-F family ATP-binding cassette domain-containing protein [Anaerostipes sp. 992a]OLR63741.1 zinc/iron permease [Anaerostipes sp. 992a]
MNILTVQQATKGYGDRILFENITLGLNKGDKVGIIGINGTGKSTLLKIIAGIEEADSGNVVMAKNTTISYLPQNPIFPKGETILRYVMDGNFEKEGEAKSILMKLGLPDYEGKTDYLSGGQKKRAALARILVNSADVLVLDEPTNHIDNEMAKWLEDYLNQFKGILVMVTHDRYFLDRVTNKIVEIDDKTLYTYETNYSGFLELKEQRENMEIASEQKRRSILRTELEWAKRGVRGRGTKQQARLDRLEELKNQSGPEEETKVVMSSITSRMGKKTIELKNISQSYEGRTFIKDFSYLVLKNERIGIIGPNGCGKTTLLQILNGRIQPEEGSVEIGDTINIGYFTQESEGMNPNQRVIDYVKETAEYIAVPEGRISASKMLERFLFTPDMQYAPIGKLSGGEQRRLYLLKILMESPNVLILDEPTNDLDIATLTILEDYLDRFEGIVITVSHDRYFLDRVVDRIFAFEEDGNIRQYEGGYSDYLSKRMIVEEEIPKEKKKKNYQKPREKKLKFTFKEQKEFETIDDDIEQLELRLEELDSQIERTATDFIKLNELMEEKKAVEEKLEKKMERWEYLNELAEKIAAQS